MNTAPINGEEKVKLNTIWEKLAVDFVRGTQGSRYTNVHPRKAGVWLRCVPTGMLISFKNS